MASNTDLMGLGTAAALAGRLGHALTGTINTSGVGGLVGAGTTQSGTPTKLTTSVTVGAPTSGQTAYLLPASTTNPTMLKEFYYFNNAATAVSALIYPPADGSTLNGSTSGAVTVAQNKSAMFMCVANSGLSGGATWFCILGS